MNDKMDRINAVSHAFAHRAKPSEICLKKYAGLAEYNDAVHFENVLWTDVTYDMWESYFEAIYSFTPEAFCYFLPSIITLSINNNNRDMLVIDGILSMLDRMPEPSYWDDFFLTRWLLLTIDECNIINDWLFWLYNNGDCCFSEATIIRAIDTIQILLNKKFIF